MPAIPKSLGGETMSPENGNQQSLAAGAVSAELSPAGGACKVPRSIRRSSPLHRPESRGLRGPAIGRPPCALPVLVAWAWIIISSPSDPPFYMVQLLAAARCPLQRRKAPSTR